MSGALVSKGLTLRSLDENKRSVDFVASTDAIDSYGDIVEQVWRLDRFLENPVILFGHNSRDLPIGQATRCEVTTANGRSQLECTVQLATAEANPVAENVWQSLLQGTLRAVSVGFVPNEYRWEKRDGKDVFVLSDNELHEISVVPIPANPEALAKMKAKALAAAGPDTDPKSPQGQETIMTEKEMQERVARADAEKALAEKTLADAHKDLSAAKTALAAAEGTITQLSTDRDGFKARAEKAEGEVVVSEVDALIGVKITPAEKDTFVELRKSNPALFTKMVAQRPDMTLLEGKIPVDKTAPPTVAKAGSSNAGDDVHNLVMNG